MQRRRERARTNRKGEFPLIAALNRAFVRCPIPAFLGRARQRRGGLVHSAIIEQGWRPAAGPDCRPQSSERGHFAKRIAVAEGQRVGLAHLDFLVTRNGSHDALPTQQIQTAPAAELVRQRHRRRLHSPGVPIRLHPGGHRVARAQMQTHPQPAQPIAVELAEGGRRANSPLQFAFESKEQGVILHLPAEVAAFISEKAPDAPLQFRARPHIHVPNGSYAKPGLAIKVTSQMHCPARTHQQDILQSRPIPKVRQLAVKLRSQRPQKKNVTKGEIHFLHVESTIGYIGVERPLARPLQIHVATRARSRPGLHTPELQTPHIRFHPGLAGQGARPFNRLVVGHAAVVKIPHLRFQLATRLHSHRPEPAGHAAFQAVSPHLLVLERHDAHLEGLHHHARVQHLHRPRRSRAAHGAAGHADPHDAIRVGHACVPTGPVLRDIPGLDDARAARQSRQQRHPARRSLPVHRHHAIIAIRHPAFLHPADRRIQIRNQGNHLMSAQGAQRDRAQIPGARAHRHMGEVHRGKTRRRHRHHIARPGGNGSEIEGPARARVRGVGRIQHADLGIGHGRTVPHDVPGNRARQRHAQIHRVNGRNARAGRGLRPPRCQQAEEQHRAPIS